MLPPARQFWTRYGHDVSPANLMNSVSGPASKVTILVVDGTVTLLTPLTVLKSPAGREVSMVSQGQATLNSGTDATHGTSVDDPPNRDSTDAILAPLSAHGHLDPRAHPDDLS